MVELAVRALLSLLLFYRAVWEEQKGECVFGVCGSWAPKATRKLCVCVCVCVCVYSAHKHTHTGTGCS